ncbi:MAG: FAD-binding oxidoreductase [Solirubrobacteraceae bacterium]
MTTITPSISHPGDELGGLIVLPADARYDEARLAWNLAVDQRPAAVVFPESVDDVVAVVRFAARRGLRVAPQSSGHGASALGDLGDTILLKTERMRGVAVDPVARTARVRAGTLWRDVTAAAADHGLAALQGSAPDVAVAGYTLGGGLSFLSRKYGLAANNVRSIELVAADGRVVRCDCENEPDLFWALRGGGGSFGIVTEIEFELFALAEVYAGVLWYPIERAGDVLHRWRDLTQSGPTEELTTLGRLLNLPPIRQIPEPVRGKSFAVVEVIHAGEPAHADELLAPLRSLGPVNDTVRSVSMPALGQLHMDPEHPVSGVGDGLMLADLPAAAVDAFVEAAGAGSAFPLLSVELRHLEGELGRRRPENGALAALDALYAMYAVGMTPVRELEAPVREQVGAVKAALAPWAARHMYLNFAERDRDPAAFWAEPAYERLRRIKAAIDPDGLMRANHPVDCH